MIKILLANLMKYGNKTSIYVLSNPPPANGIDLPFPTQQILFHDQTEETDGVALTKEKAGPQSQKITPSREVSMALLR